MKRIVGLLLLLSLFASSLFVTAQQLAFPTAEGAGKFTKGGRGTIAAPTTVFYVTSLADDGSVGTLRYAVTQSATNRTILFNVSGTIHLNSKLNIKANTTIAGQTAPAGGICIADYNVSLSGDNIIVRYIRFRLGDKNQLKTNPANCGLPISPFSSTCMPIDGSGGDDCFSGTGRKNIIIDHCTFSWSNDETCSIYAGDSTTMQWCVFSEPLNYSYHFETGDTDFEHHGYGGIWGGKTASFHHNLLAHCQGRACRFDGSRNLGNGSTTGLENCEFSNNVIYNWGAYNVNGGEGGNYNITNNYYKYGANTSVKNMVINPYITSPLPYGKYFVSGNYIDGYSSVTNNNWLGAKMNGGTLADTTQSKVTTAFPIPAINMQSATSAYTSVLSDVGASIPSRDTLDDRIVVNVKNRTGKIIDVQGGYPHGTAYNLTVNAWPTLSQGNISLDSDIDGMPDWWETRNNLNKNLASDRTIVASNGYTNLENYIDSIPKWNKHANFERFTGTKISSAQVHFIFATNWVKDSFTYSLFKCNDSLGFYTKVVDVNSEMNTINFTIDDNTFSGATTFYKVGSYKIGVTADTLYTNIVRIDGTVTPVKIRNYTINLINKTKVLNSWTTAIETNASHFNIQKSTDSKNFETIGTVSANGFASDYTFIDHLTNNYKQLFYRLEIIDKDGSKNYSSIQNLQLNTVNKINVYPNPTKGNFIIESDQAKALNIIDNFGRVVKAITINNKKQIISTENLTKGVYILKIIMTNGDVSVQKITLE